jgi:uncharacterized repeat protein (TIGR01451 family)
VLSQNAISANGTIVATNGTAASNGIGIDLNTDGVTLNDDNDADTGANSLLNFPVIETATIRSIAGVSSLVLTGYAVNASKIELFSVGATADGSGFGEGPTYLGQVTENGSAGGGNLAADAANGGGNVAYSGTINGVNQGADTKARAFSFTIPLSSLPGGTLATASKLTSTATLSTATSEFGGNVTVLSAPVAVNDNQATAQNTTTFIDWLSNDTDADGNATIVGGSIDLDPGTAGQQLTLTVAGQGTFTYLTTGVNTGKVQFTPIAIFVGTASATYTVNDNTGLSSNIATISVPISSVADVVTSIVPTPSPANAGSSLSFAVTFGNNGPGAAAGVTRQVQLPLGLGVGNVTASNGGSYDNVTGLVTYTPTPTTINNGANVNSTIVITAVPASFASITATSTITTTTSQGFDLGANTANSTVTVTPVADVQTTLSGPTALTAGQPSGSYTVTFTNGGPSSGATVTRTVTLPAGSTSITAVGGSVAGTTITYPTLNPMANAATASFNFSFTAPNTSGAAVSIGSATSTTTSENGATANNTATVNANIALVADVTATLTGPTQLNAGLATGSFSATFSNEGPTPASDVTQVVTLPAGSTMDAGQQAALPLGASYSSGTNTIDFGTLATLAVGTSNTVSFSFTAPTTTGSPNLGVSTTTSSSEGLNVAPNAGTLALTVNAVADVMAAITPSAATVSAGQAASFSVSFTDNGAQAAAGVTRSVQLPTGLSTYGAVTASNGGTYNNASGLVTYTPTPTTISVGTPLTSTISFTMPGSGTVSATASVATTTNEGGLTTNNTATAHITATAAFDLLTTLSGPASAVEGSLVTLNVSTRNIGPALAPAAVQTVQLTAGLSSVFVSNGGSYNSGTGLVSFPALALPAGQSVANTISFVAPAAAFAPSATVTPNTTPTGDTAPANNLDYLNSAASATDLVITAPTAAQANVYATITPSAQSVAATTVVTLTVTAGNAGPSAAASVVPSVQLLPGLTTTTLTVASQVGTLAGTTITYPSGAVYSTTTGVVTFPTLATLASGATQTYAIQLTTPTNAGNNGQILATAAVATATSDPMPANNVAATLVTVLPTADLATTVVGPATPVAGQLATYQATFSNLGASAATGVQATAQLPIGLSGVVVQDGAGTTLSGAYDALSGLVTFPMSSAAAGEAQAFTMLLTVPVQGFTVRSAVGAATPDPVAGNNRSNLTVTPTLAADLAVVVSGPATAVIGNAVTYSVNLTNNGPGAAALVTPRLQLPTGLTILSNSTGATYVSGSGLVSFTQVASLPVGATLTNYITFVMSNPAGGQLTGTASTATTTTDPVVANNTYGITTSVMPATTGTTSANLAAAITASASPVNAGSSLTLTASFTNAGPNPGLSVTPMAFLPTGLSVTAVSNSGSYDPSTGAVSWPAVASQASGAGGNLSYTISLLAPATGPLLATAAVASATSDPTTSNNVSSTSVAITAMYDEKTSLAGPASALPGSSQMYTVTTVNNGPSVSPSATQTVVLPAGVTASSISGGGSQAGTTITFPAVSNQVAGTIGTITNTFLVTMPATGNLTMTAIVTAAGESDLSNNQAPLTTLRANQLPLAGNVVNTLKTPQGETAGQQLISTLRATDADGTVSTYALSSLPDASTQGVLYYDNAGSYTAITSGNVASLTLTTTQAGTLKFDPVAGFSGNAFFGYTATDNNAGVSNVALYAIATGIDNLAQYALATPKGGTGNQYLNGNVLASVVDVNGSTYDAVGSLTFNGLTVAALTTGPLPAGTALNPVTGQITVTDRSLLLGGTYPLTITSTDSYGGVTVHNIALTIGASPVAVEDVATTTPNTAVTFFVTNSDLPNGGTAIDVATIDLDLNTAGVQTSITTAQGTFTTDLVAPGTVMFTPVAAFVGTATTPYMVQNAVGAYSNQANLVVKVQNPAPVDLSTTISASASPVSSGSPETLTLTMANNSATSASSVVQSVRLPLGLTGFSYTINGVAAAGSYYSTTTGLVSFPAATLAAGATATYTVRFNAPTAGPFTATAQVTNSTADPVPANNTALTTISVDGQFDLTTTIDGPTAVTAGDLATYTVVTRNLGPSPAPAAVQTVQLPTALAGVFATNGGEYNPGTGVVTFPAVALANGQSANNTVSFAFPAAAFTASATVLPNTTLTGDPVPANNTATATATAVNAATATKANTYVEVSGPANVTPGQAGVTYTVTQGNHGPAAATSVVTKVSLPVSLTVATLQIGGVSGSLSGGIITFAGGITYTQATGIVSFPSIASQASASTQAYTISLTVPANATALTVSASTSLATSDPVPGDNVASLLTNIAHSIDVAVTLTGPTTTLAGEPVAYLVRTVNNGATAAKNVDQVLSIPAKLDAATLYVGGVTGTLSAGIITFASGATYNVESGVVTLPTLAALAAGASQVSPVAYLALVPNSGTGPMRNVATVSSSTPDGVLTNNSSFVNTTSTVNQDITIRLSGPAQAVVGNPVVYTVVTSNNGPSTSGSQVTTLQLPVGLGAVEVRGNNGNVVASLYDATTGLVTFASATVTRPGFSTLGTVQFTVPDVVLLSVAAAVTPSGVDINLDNNTAVVNTPVIVSNLASVDLTTTVIRSLNNQPAGTTITFTAVTTNNTAGTTAVNVLQTVALQAGLANNGNAVTVSNGGSYNNATGLVTFPAVATMASGGGAAITNTIDVVLPGVGPVTAVATAKANNPDPDLTDNTSRISATVTTVADYFTKVTGPATAMPGSTVIYTVVTGNDGPSASGNNMVQTVTLPAGVTGYSLNNGAAQVGNVVTINVNALQNGLRVSNLISFTAPATSFSVDGSVTSSNTTEPATGALNNAHSCPTAVSNRAPVANDVVNTLQAPCGNTATTSLPISSLSADDTDGTVDSYTITAIPPVSQGILYYKNAGSYSPVTVGQVVLSLDASTMKFAPAAAFVGNVNFRFTSTDNLSAVSNEALYTINVALDNASLYASAPVIGGVNQYPNGYTITKVFDPNGGAYSAIGAEVDNGVRNAQTNAAGTALLLQYGLSLDAATGLISVANRSKLVAGNYSISITTTDVFGGVTTQPVAFSIGDSPLPIELTVFTAQAVQNRDARLQWRTASEKDNDHFDVERSLDGRVFTKFAQVAGQGNSSRPTDYALTDAGIARQGQRVYYRLRQVDTDGTASYSPVQVVRFEQVQTPSLSVYPNPVGSSTQLDLGQLPAGQYQVRVLDATGRVIVSQQLAAGLVHGLDLGGLASGTYFVTVSSAEAGTAINLMQRVLKQ